MSRAINSQFQRGSACYGCLSCGRKTRSTGQGDNEMVRLCVECYELAGIENEMSDHGRTPELIAEIKKLQEVISTKGGKLIQSVV